MVTQYTDSNRFIKIGLLGPSFDTSNRGVSALAEGSIKCILSRWPDTEITLLAGGRESIEYTLRILGKEICVNALPIRFCKNIFLQNHFCVLILYGLIVKLLPLKFLRKRIISRNTCLRRIREFDFVADITAGDSFSDIYGLKKFFWVFSLKWLVLFFGKDLIMLPQTYGPYNKRITRVLARYIINRAKYAYSRDKEGLDTLKKLLGKYYNCNKIKFLPDVAFVLDPREPRDIWVEPDIPQRSSSNKMPLVGLNISGLLFNGGFTGDNMFGLNVDYRLLVRDIICLLIRKKCRVLLVPHVFARVGRAESDPDACLHIYNEFKTKHEGRLFLVKGEYDHNEIKYIIGMCDFFIGSRMHSCIGAMSQTIPTIGVAYSKKFRGVFESIGVEDCVADARICSHDELIKKISMLFDNRVEIKERLIKHIPQAKKQILNIFTNFSYS